MKRIITTITVITFGFLTIILLFAGCRTIQKHNSIDTNQISAEIESEIIIEEPTPIDPPRYAQ